MFSNVGQKCKDSVRWPTIVVFLESNAAKDMVLFPLHLTDIIINTLDNY